MLLPAQHEWIEAGFFIVSDGAAPDRGSDLLPPRIVTVSTCIVESYPDAWALPWVQPPSDELDRIRDALALGATAFSSLRAWVDEAIENGDYGWPNVFLSVGAAREFGQRFLGAVKNRRLLGLSLAVDFAKEFLREEAPQGGRGGSGIWSALHRTRRLKPLEPSIGFDVLGIESSGSLHTSTCNGLERAYSEQLGISFNRYGLIENYAMALAAHEYTIRDEVGAEPVGWYPFRVDEYAANTTS